MPGATRAYRVLGGIQTSEILDPATPTDPSDTLNKEYADATYAKLAFHGDAVADTAALKAIAEADRSDKQLRLKEDTGNLWRFDSASSATEDGTTIIQPTTGSGRWLVASGGGSSSGGTASAVELLQTKNELAAMGFVTRPLDNALRANGLERPPHKDFLGYLIENYTSGGASAKIVWNPVTVNSDTDYDSITNWAAGGAGTTLAATAGSTKVGANHFSFNKDGSAVDAYITQSLAAQTLNVGANYRLYFWVDMPSVTNLSSIYVHIAGAAVTDFSRWNLTTNYAGSALATGYNLMFVDLVNTAASTTGGTVWTTSQLARYVRFGVTTSSAGQTYTGIKFGGAWFSHGDVGDWNPKYFEFTGYDTSNKRDFVLDSTNTRVDGQVTLASSVAQSYTAGIAGAATARFARSTLAWSPAGLIGFDSALSSGTIAIEQEMRLSKNLRESLSANYGLFCDMYTPQIYRVTEITSGTVFKVSDTEDHHLNLLSGDSLHCFTTTKSLGEATFALLETKALTANSSYLSSVTTLTVASTSGMAVGDYVVKSHLTVHHAVAAASANESFGASTLDATPNGVQLIGSRPYPNPSSVYGHWWMGGPTSVLALMDQSGNGRTLVNPSGSINTADAFKSGKFAVSGMNTSNILRTAAATAPVLSGNDELIQLSIWYYHITGNSGCIASVFDNVSNGWVLNITSNQVNLYNSNGATVTNGITLATASWHHICMQIRSSVVMNLYVNGSLATTTPGSFGAAVSTIAMYFGARGSSSLDSSLDTALSSGARLADCILWRDGAQLSQSDVNALYSAGVPQWFGFKPSVIRSEYNQTGESGARISTRMKLNRSTSAISPYILTAGMIKTG